jgi:RNA polymerase sigma factor (sigma-70 family)
MSDDISLLREFVDERSDAAFRELVVRKFDFVYGAAVRQVGGDAHLARDVAQNVFIDLARKARTLAGRPTLAGWLYTSTRFAASKALRSRSRRLVHESAAHATHAIMTAHTGSEDTWDDLRPILDSAMHELSERDRDVILLRFFEGRAFAEMGGSLGIGENAARMRVERALEKLRERLARRGVTSTTAALGLTLAGQPLVSAPAGLAATIAGTSLATAAVRAGSGLVISSSILQCMNTGKLIATTVGVVAAVGLGVYLGVKSQIQVSAALPLALTAGTNDNDAGMRAEISHLRLELSRVASERSALSTSRAKPSNALNASVNPLEPLRVLTNLQQRKLAKSEVDFINSDARFTPAFAELFALTPMEQEVLQRSVDTARDRLAELERANATVSRATNGDVLVAVKAFPEAGGDVYDRMLQTFAETLGPERNNAFFTLGLEELEKTLGRFGTPQRTIKFSRTDATDGSVRYAMQEHLKLPKENGNYTSDFASFAELTRQAGAIVKLLPADFVKQ